MRVQLWLTALCVAGITAAAGAADAKGEYKAPRAVVPYVGAAPPKIDGVISPGEYDNAASVGAMVAWPGAPTGRVFVADIQQVVWYLGYDEKYFYISMRSPNPPGVWPLARVKTNDAGNPILYDDHVEIQIAKRRDKATFGGVGFYKITANANAHLNDEWYYNGTPGTEGEWAIGGPIKCSVTKDHWDLEIAIDIRAFDEKNLDGQTWVLQLLRADSSGGLYFAGWVGQHWMGWNEFGEVTFSRTAPALQFRAPAQMTTGKMRLDLAATGQTDQPTPVEVQVKVTDGDGKTVFDQTQKAQAQKGKVAPMPFEKDLPLTEENILLEITGTYPGPEGEREVFYHVQVPVRRFTQEFFDKHVAPWLAARPKGDLDWQFAYWPSYDVVRTTVDTAFFGIQENLATAKAFEVAVVPRGGGAALATGRADMPDRAGELILKNVKLPAGDYRAKLTVFGADGKTVVSEKSLDFVRRNYPWEGNKLGKTDAVHPPFTPIVADAEKRTLKVWGRTYTVGPEGLLSQIEAAGGARSEPILTGPMEVIASADGKEVKPAGAKVAFGASAPERVELSSTGQLGATGYRLEAALEYDGWYHVRLTVDPGAKPAKLDGLAVRVPLWGDADTIYAQRAGDARRGNKFGAIPAGDGLVWSSADLLPFGAWKSFCPILFLGNGDKGLWWFAQDNRSWAMSDQKAALEVRRGGKGVVLDVNLLAGPTELAGPRTFEFAFLVDPVKQIADERKWGWGRLAYSHNTFGYRMYGDSVDGYEISDEGLEALRNVLVDPLWKPPADLTGYTDRHSKAFRAVHYPAVGERNEMVVLYGSTSLTGLGLPAFDTYGGEWLGRTNWQPHAQTEFRNGYNVQGSCQWTTPRQLSTVGVNFTPSYEDCFVWHHYRLLSRVPVNGTWWDNGSITQIRDYDPATGQFYLRFNVFQRRRLMKRLVNIGWEVGRRPWWISNLHCDWSWNQVAWHVENDFYTDNADASLLDQLSMDEFRALCRIKRGIIHRYHHACADRNITSEQIRRKGRSVVGMCLLHDIGNNLPHKGDDTWFVPGMLKVLEDNVNFFGPAEFIGYWRRDNPVKISTPNVYASVYRNGGKAVVVVVNANRNDVDVTFELGRVLTEGAVTKISDGETGFVFGQHYDAKLRRYVTGEFAPHTFGMSSHGVRLLVLE